MSEVSGTKNKKLGISDPDLRKFVEQSSAIEGIFYFRTNDLGRDIATHKKFLSKSVIGVEDLEAFTLAIAGAELRVMPGMNVIVGNHRPPLGGPEIKERLSELLLEAQTEPKLSPWATHVKYETLHPFMDGNGRSGRALWLWQMIDQNGYHAILPEGFLHSFYYQTLSNVGKAVT